MSLFLAPIHFSMYDKIKKQDEITKTIVNKYDENILKEVEENLGTLLEGELQDIIDTSAIHPWLQGKIDIVESVFAKSIEKLIDENIATAKNIEEDFKKLGKNFKGIDNTEEVYRLLTTNFLDGMPCDMAIRPIELTEERSTWTQNLSVHSRFWEDEGILYNNFRKAWLEGVAEENSMKISTDGVNYEVVKCTE